MTTALELRQMSTEIRRRAAKQNRQLDREARRNRGGITIPNTFGSLTYDLMDSTLEPFFSAFKSTDAAEFTAALEALRASLSVPQKIHDQLLTQLGSEMLREVYLTAAVDYRIPMPIFPDEHAAITMNAARAGLPEVVGDAIVKRMGDSSGESILKQIASQFWMGMALKP